MELIRQMIPYWNEKEKLAMLDVLDGDFINEHKKVREFEKRFADYVNAKYCVLVTSGSVALYMALQASDGVTKPDQVPSYQGIFVAHAMKQNGTTPKITDVDKNGLMNLIDPNSFVVQANGRVEKTKILEDCCQATFHHTKYRVSCYSFAPTKHLTMGQGGAVCTDSFEVYEKLVMLKDHGRSDRYTSDSAPKDIFTEWGSNYKVTEFQASFGLEQLKKLPRRYHRLHEIYTIYHDELNSTVGFLDKEPKWFIDVYVDDPENLITKLKVAGISANRIHKPIHMQPEFRDSGAICQQSEQLYNHGVFLPSTTNLTDEQVLRICNEIKVILK